MEESYQKEKAFHESQVDRLRLEWESFAKYAPLEPEERQERKKVRDSATFHERRLEQMTEPAQLFTPKVSKPLSECPTCMASIHGLLWAVPAIITLSLPFWVAAPWVVCLAGLVEVLAGLAWKGGGE